MENNNDDDTHDFYFLVRNYVENNRKEEELFAILALVLSQEQYFDILDAISDILRFLKADVESLKDFLITEIYSLKEQHIKHFIRILNEKLPYEDETTFIFPDHRLALFQQKVKRALTVLLYISSLITNHSDNALS